MRTVVLALAACAAIGAHFAGAQKIKHVVTLMLENRAYDHMMGGMPGGMDGKTVQMPKDPADPSKGSIEYASGAAYVDPDPDHSVCGTTQQIFGKSVPAPGDPELMNGFAWNALSEGKDAEQIIKYFTPTEVPVISALGNAFALMTRWWPSVPGPTLPNRAYYQSGTSHGICDDNVLDVVEGYPQRTIYDVVESVLGPSSWRSYFEEVPDALVFASARNIDRLSNFRFMTDFAKDVNSGDLPFYTFISPAYFTLPDVVNASDQHPSHDVTAGERLIKEVYETLRNSPVWNDTLLVVTYDEHGGFADLQTPPLNIPNPDGLNCSAASACTPTSAADPTGTGFDFTRGGVRIPTILVSPWIDQQVVGAPPASAKPMSNSEYEATSVIHTVRNMLNVSQPMTRRDAWAAPFDHLINRATPRTDCPTSLPTPPPGEDVQPVLARGGAAHHRILGTAPITDLQRALLKLVGTLKGPIPTEADLDNFTEAEASIWARQRVSDFLGRRDPVLDRIGA